MVEREDEGMKLIGLVGRAGAGKTTVAKHLIERYGFKKAAFADALKMMLYKAGMCTAEELWGEKTEHSRWLLQKIGTEIFRKQVSPLFWVQRTALEIKKHLDAGERVVIDDIRFPEEAAMVRAHLSDGLLIRLERGNYIDSTAGITHESESQVQAIDCNHIITANSGEVDKLIWQMDEIIKNERLFLTALDRDGR
jgi:hypothetical protein